MTTLNGAEVTKLLKNNITIIMKSQTVLHYDGIEESRHFLKDNNYFIHTDEIMYICNMDSIERIIIKRV